MKVNKTIFVELVYRRDTLTPLFEKINCFLFKGKTQQECGFIYYNKYCIKKNSEI